MTDFEREDEDVIAIQKKHGPGGELPTISLGTAPMAGSEKKVPCQPLDASWHPAKGTPTDIDRVKAAAISVGKYAVLSAIVFYWQQAGFLDHSAAFPALLVLALLGGISIGRRVRA